nr:hypothetical protein [Bradyrhizobium diazoefficiens]
MEDLKRDMAILATSGRDWTDRTRRLGARVPGLDIFSQALIERSPSGWRITEKGRAVLEVMEGRSADPPLAADEPELQSTEVPSLPVPVERDRRQSGRRQRRRAVREQARVRAS